MQTLNFMGTLCLAFYKIHFDSNLAFYGVVLSVLLSELYYPCRYLFSFLLSYSIALSINIDNNNKYEKYR